MVKSFDAETVLRSLLFDVDRMIRDKSDPKDILRVLKRKTNFLSKETTTYRIKWW